MRQIIFLLLILIISLCKVKGQGLCYGKALMPDIYESAYELFPVYKGDYTNQSGLTKIEIEVQEARIEWEEKINENCLSPNPEDCKMLCAVEIPSIVESYYIVIDTINIKDFLWEKIKVERLLRKGGDEEYIPVLCSNKIDRTFVQYLTEQLQNRGYYLGKQHDFISEGLKEALIKFQKDNGLPVGQLDLTSLSQLGFEYKK